MLLGFAFLASRFSNFANFSSNCKVVINEKSSEETRIWPDYGIEISVRLIG